MVKKFLLRTLLFTIPIWASMTVFFVLINGYIDPYYLRFTTPRQTSLILGTSRAAQGIQPNILNKKLGRKDFFNYSFTRSVSPYGPTYLNSVHRKLDTRTKNGMFILTVDAWSLSSNGKNPNDSLQFEEQYLCLGKTKFVNLNPNVPYILNSYASPYVSVFFKKKSLLLHNNGWLEVMMNTDTVDTKTVIEKKAIDYRFNILPKYHYSSTRYQYLMQTIKYLKKHGKVYLVTLPVHPEIMKIDQVLVPHLDSLVTAAALECNVPYLNMTSENAQFEYIDGNHLYKMSGKKVTSEIADWMLKR